MAETQRAPLGSIATQRGLIGGPFGSNLVGRDYVGEGVPVIRGQNLARGRFVDFGDCVYVTEEKAFGDLKTNLAAPGDLVFTQRGTLGQLALVPQSVHPVAVISQSQMRLRVDPKVADAAYVYYACSSSTFNDDIQTNAIVTGVPHINLGILGRLQIPLPPLDEQRRIAEVLGGLDELIETNEQLLLSLRRLQDATARHLSDGATHLMSLGEVAGLRRERASGDADSPFLGLENFAEDGGGIVTQGRLGDVGLGQQAFTRGDLLYGRLRPYFRKVDRVGFDGSCTGEIWVVRPTSDVPVAWLAAILSRPEFTDFAMSGSEGTKMPRAKWDHVARFQVPIPPRKDLAEFSEAMDTIWEQIWALKEESAGLRNVRDELLPLLTSGVVRVAPQEVAR